jgi:hypothetical protein
MKMASVDAKTRRSGNYCVILYTPYSAREVVNKCWCNMMHGTTALR